MSVLNGEGSQGNRTGQQQQVDERRSQQIRWNQNPRSNQFLSGIERSNYESASAATNKVKFINTTSKFVEVIWLDYEGQRVKVNTLAPFTAFSVQTHPSHPWIFRDADTNETLVIKKLNVKGSFFETSDYLSCLSSSPDFSLQQRQALASGNGTICVFIQLPVEDLRQLALRTVRQNVSKKEDCFCLDIPLSIQFELAQMFV